MGHRSVETEFRYNVARAQREADAARLRQAPKAPKRQLGARVWLEAAAVYVVATAALLAGAAYLAGVAG